MFTDLRARSSDFRSSHSFRLPLTENTFNRALQTRIKIFQRENNLSDDTY